MSDQILKDQIAAATAYEELHVPALFQQWPGRLLAAIEIQSGDRVLDVACGTGVLARQVSARVGSNGKVAGIDPDAGMIAVAGRLAPVIEWRQGAAESLPYGDAAFDAVVSQFGLMFFADRPQACSEMARVLAPGGRLCVAVWDALENSPAYPIEVALLESIAGKRAAEALRAPFVLGDRNELFELLDSAGITVGAITMQTGTARFPSVRAMVEADLRGWLPVMGVVLDEGTIERILTEAESALRSYVTSDGQVVFDCPALIASGSKQ